ncbi:MAG: NAD(P)-dependent oxidoreductase [Reyranellaceae bacterium]
MTVLPSVAFIGLGTMGMPMALNLARRGVSVLAIGRRPGALAELRRAGLEADTALSRALDAEVVFLCLPDGDAVRSVLLDGEPHGVAWRPGQVVVDTSTIEYRIATEIAGKLASADVAYLDCPITGMAQRARDGTLTMMCGGDRLALERVRPLLECVASDVLYLGASGSGQLAKLVNQLLFDINAAALAEILPLAVKLGLDAALVGRIVNGGTGRSYASEFFVPGILENRFDRGYPLQAAYKDLVSGVDVAMAHRIPTPVLSAAVATYQSALLHGHGASDKGAMIRVFEDLLGVRFRNEVKSEAITP